jgi:hypothetical protein
MNGPKRLIINGKQVDSRSIEIDGIDQRDYPDFSDAYISYAEFVDGTALNDLELDKLNNQEGELVNNLAHDRSIREVIRNTVKEVLKESGLTK